MSDDTPTPAQRLAALAKANQRGRSMAEIAEAGGIAEGTVRAVFEARNNSYRSRTMLGLSVALQVSLEEVYGAVGRPAPATRLAGAERLDPASRAKVQALIFDLLDRQQAQQEQP